MSKRIIVVGGGLAGLSATIKAAEMGFSVDLFSMVPVKRSHSVCAQGGINAAKNLKGENDSTSIHTDDTLFGGEFLADQALVKGMCDNAPRVIDLLDRMGVPFNRTPEGNIDFRRFGGTMHHRTAFSGATTGQQLMYALDEQVRRYEAAGQVEKYEYWEFLSLVLDDNGSTRGISAMNIWDRHIETFKGNAVIMCTGGPGIVFGKSTNSVINTGAAASRAYQQGVWYANGEFIQVHPTSIPGQDKLRLISESVRGEGGRVWVPKDRTDRRAAQDIPDADRDYFLERKYPKFGNLVPRDVATREIFHIVTVEKRGVDGINAVYLDITPARSGQSAETLEKKLGGVLEIYRKFVGDDPIKVPMKIFPGMHYSMGGLWVSAADGQGMMRQMTNIPGTFAAGEVEFQYHGANRLGANSLLSCIYGGDLAGMQAVEYCKSLKVQDAPSTVFDRELTRQNGITESLMRRNGDENAFKIGEELGNWMTEQCTVVRDNVKLDELLAKLDELEERSQRLNPDDPSKSVNQAYSQARAIRDMIILARAMAKGARLRDECRGAHYKPEFELHKPDADKLGNPAAHPGYRAFIGELKEKWNGSYAAPQSPGGELSPEFTEYMDKWVAQQRDWMKSTVATFQPGNGTSSVSVDLRPVAVTAVPPRPRIYK